MKIKKYQPKHINEWNSFVLISNNGTLFHNQQFISYHIEREFIDCSLMIYNDNKLIALFPAAMKDNSTVFSHPGASHGGLVIKNNLSFSVINNIILPSFLAIEKNWNEVDTVDGPIHLVDIKFELGIKSIDNSIVLSDVVDNDSWRIWPGGNPKKQLDKQTFREGEDLINVANKYELVTKLTSQFKGVN